MLGNTPMIGQNDSPGRSSRVADAVHRRVLRGAKGIAELSFWAEGRDNDGCPNAGYASVHLQRRPDPGGRRLHPGVPVLHRSGSGGTAGRRLAHPDARPRRPRTSSPSGSCATAWVSNGAYTSGNEVSYNGDDWTANQWNYDEVPGGASGAWNNDGSC